MFTATRGRPEGPRSPVKVARFQGKMMKLFSSRSGGLEGGRKLLVGLELKNFAADSNFSEKKNGIFVATGPGPCQIIMTSTVKYMADKSSVLFISLNKSLDFNVF